MGTTVREYDLLESLGAGGMGEVFKARHTLLDAYFAVKVIHKDLTRNPEIRQRFIQEAKFLAKLDHPGIMRLRNVFEEDERLYIVTDYLKGETLGRVLGRAQDVTLEDGMDWLYQIAAGVDYAHKNGVVHRDLKPANIMVLENGNLQILDFGLAKQFDVDSGGVTTPDQFLGTPPYLPPEILRGDVRLRDIGPEADVYALGVMAYRMYAGVLPHRVEENDSPFRQLSILIRKHLDGVPVEALGSLRPDLPSEFSECIMIVLTAPQSTRPRSAKTLIEMLIRGAAKPAGAPAAAARPAGKPKTLELPAMADLVHAKEEAGWNWPTRTVELPALPEIEPVRGPSPAREREPEPEPDEDAPPARRGRPLLVAVVAMAAVAAVAAGAWFGYFADRMRSPAIAGIVVKVQPEDAKISIDGAVVSRSSLHEDRSLPAGRHEILVEKRGHRPYRETLDVVAGTAVDRLIMLQKASGTVAITTEPPGAAVTIDGAAVAGATPFESLNVQAEVEHAIVARMEGRKPAEAVVELVDGERKAVSLTLAPAAGGTLDVETTPDEVGIWLDGEYVGTTPAEIADLEAERDIAVRLAKAGYEGATFSIRLAPGERRTVAKRLALKESPEPEEPLPVHEKPPPKAQSRVLVVDGASQAGKGFLNVESSPAAYLYVDGRFTGRSTPVIGHPLPEGGHTVTLRTPDGREQSWRVQVKPGETVRLTKEF
ncbi:MAG: serine/threonine protein kinase [Deltaproteobacteria bacterium]|nr:serine/threonine protein kinase [Deltaproteobacteria bacterium]